MDNKHYIDKLFKRGVDKYEVKPSNDLWSRIAEELDNKEATHTKPPLMRYAALLLVFIGVSLISVPLSNRNSTFNAPIADNTTTAEPTNLIAERQPAASETKGGLIPVVNSFSETITFKAIIASAEQLSPFTSSPIAFEGNADELLSLPTPVEEEVFTSNNNSVKDRVFNSDKSLDVIGFNAFAAEINNKGNNNLLESPSNIISTRDLDKSGLYVGTSGSYYQTSLLEYGSVFKGERPIQPSLKFGTSKGVLMGYNFNNKFGVEAEYLFNSVLGQNYVMSEDESILEKSLLLTYDLIPVVAKIKVGKVSNLTNQPIVLNYVGGIQYGQLKEARLPQDKRYDETTEELFKSTSLSVVLGLEYDIFLQDNIVLSMGARGTFSDDISTHVEPFNDFAKRNFTFGLRGSVSYLLQ